MSASGSIQVEEPQISGQPVSEFVTFMMDRLACFVEEVTAHCLQKHVPEGLSITEIPLARRSTEMPEILARALRALESLAAEEQANQDAEAALKEGRIFIAVLTDGSANQKSTVERILKEHNAHTLRFFGCWTVERL